ncbi:MAG: class I SAM-dependent methyltransferase [Bdellovibrionales bacterium]|nr:class I SAM-dependent methyltransferase [Bdellovibrionales bacterium]
MTITSDSLQDRLQQAREKREASTTLSQTSLRLFDGEGDGIAGLWIDRFGEVIIVHLREDRRALQEQLRGLSPHLPELFGVSSGYLRIHETDPKNSALHSAVLLFGDPIEELWVKEGALEFLVRPSQQVNGGLFLDARDLRCELARISSGKRVLNTFAFTGTLGIAAFSGDALEVVQVDISKSILRWAKENYERNFSSSPRDGMRFIAEDSRSFMARENRRIEGGKEPYDIVLIDPPAFGRSDGKPFRLLSELENLIQSGVSLLAEGGELFISCNVRQIGFEHLEKVASREGSRLGRRITNLERLLPPSDFTNRSLNAAHLRGIRLRVS